MSTDPAAAADFYAKVIGWKPQGWSQDSTYTMFLAEAGPMAGLMLLPEDVRQMGSPPCWMTYIGVPDVDATAQRAAELGGRVYKQPTDIPTIGRFAVIADPQGAVFIAFSPLGSGMGDGPMTMGDYSWHELITTDWETAFSFYEALFGWARTDAMDMGPMGVYQMFGWPGKTLGGMFNRPPSMPVPPHWMPYVLVADAKKAAEMVTALGGRILNGPMQVPGGDWVVNCMDPQGAAFAVHSVQPAAPAPVKKPAAKKPVKQVAKKPVAQKPVAKKPAARKPIAKKMVGKKPVAKSPVKQVARKPVAKKPVAKKPVAKKPLAKKPVAKKPAAKKPLAKKPVGKKPAAKKPVKKVAKKVATKPVARKPMAKKPAARSKKR
jgi:uncharacterized protein